MKKDKINIFYRHFNISGTDSRRPKWFDYEKCFQNLLSTINPETEKLYVIYDTSKGTDNWIFKYSDKFKLVEIQAGDDMTSFFKTVEYVDMLNLPDNELIYFLENDYLHKWNWTTKVYELFNSFSGLNYVSLYDHLDKYVHPMYDDLVSKIFVTNMHHWRTTPSTCGSFIIDTNIFNLDKDILSTMRGDHNKFLWLNENRGRFVLTPIPSLSTHVMNDLLAPTINWFML